MEGRLLAPRGCPANADPEQDRAQLDTVTRHLYSLGDIPRVEFAWDAADKGDVQVLRVLQSAPESMPLIDADVLSEVNERFAEVAHPDAYAELQQARSVASYMHTDFARASRETRQPTVDVIDQLL